MAKFARWSIAIVAMLVIAVLWTAGAPTASAKTPEPTLVPTATRTLRPNTRTPTATPITTCVVTAELLNVRSSALSSAPVVATLKQGDVVTPLETKNGWIRHSKGWSSAKFLECGVAMSTATISATVAVTGTVTTAAVATTPITTSTSAAIVATAVPIVATATTVLLPIVATPAPAPTPTSVYNREWFWRVASITPIDDAIMAYDEGWEVAKAAGTYVFGQAGVVCVDLPPRTAVAGTRSGGSGSVEEINFLFRYMKEGGEFCTEMGMQAMQLVD